MKTINLFLACLFMTALSYAQPSFQWVKTFGGTLDEKGSAIATDASDNVYVTGYFKNVVDFDPGPGTYTLSSNSPNFSDIYITKFDAAGNLLWARSMGIPNSDDEGTGITSDPSGNVYVTGIFSGIVDFDPGPATYTLAGSSADIFILKLNAAGNFVWARNMGGTGSDYGYAIALDASANVYTTGFFNNTADFDPGPATYTVASKGSIDVFVSKLDVNGNFVWARGIGGTNNDVGYSITTDGSGNVYTGGSFKGTCDFDPSAATYTLATGGGEDIFVSKLDASGNFVWAKSMKGSATGYNAVRCVKTDAAGNVYASGFYSGITDFDPGPATYTLNSGGFINGIISKLDPSGNLLWVGEVWNGDSPVMSIALDASGNVYGGGSYGGTADFDPSASTYSISTVTNSEDVYLFKWDAAGAFVWAQSVTSATTAGSTSRLFGVAMNPVSGNIYTTGFFNYTQDFDPGPGTTTVTTTGSWDVFVHKTGQTGFCIAPAAPVNTTPTANQTLCSGSSTTLTASSTGTLSWYATPTSTMALTTGTVYTTTALAAGQYTYYAEASTCTVSATRTAITLTVNASPTIAVNSGSICNGSSFTLTPTGASTYTISGGSTVVSPTTTSSYTITGTSAAGCVSQTQAISTITVNALPSISANSGSICSGNSFTIMPTGASTYTISGGSAIVSPTTTTSYTISGTSAAGCVSQVQALSTVTVNSLPSISVNSGSICSGNSFTIMPTGASTYTISGGSAIVSPTTTTSYTVSGTSSTGCIGQAQAISTIMVNALPSISVNSGSICSGSSFTIMPTGASTYTISGGSAIVSPATTTSYTITGTSAAGCIGQGQAVSTVTVSTRPSITVVSTPTLICIGESAKLTASGATTYTWSTGVNTTSISVSPTITTTYSVTGRSSTSGCTNMASITQSVSACTSLMETEAGVFQVYPNPNQGSFSIRSTSGLDDLQLEITDAAGRIVYSLREKAQEEVVQVNLTDYAKGLYFLKLSYKGKYELKKLIIE